MLVLHVLPCLEVGVRMVFGDGEVHSIFDLRTELELPGLVMSGEIVEFGHYWRGADLDFAVYPANSIIHLE